MYNIKLMEVMQVTAGYLEGGVVPIVHLLFYSQIYIG